MSEVLDRLARAVDAGDVEAAAQAAIDVGQSAYDLELRYRPVTEVDMARFDLWLAQLQLDAAADDAAVVNGDQLSLDYIRGRFIQALASDAVAKLNSAMEELQVAVGDGELSAASGIAHGIRELIAVQT